MGAYDRRRALIEIVPPATGTPPAPGGLPPADWPWRAIADVAVENLLRVVHDLGAPTQARVDAAAALLTHAESKLGA